MKNEGKFETDTQQNCSPADFPLGSPESRARAREMADREHTPAFREWMRIFRAYCELSDQVHAQGAKADPADVKLVREYRDFYSDCVREWRAEGSLDGSVTPYATEHYRKADAAEANQGAK